LRKIIYLECLISKGYFKTPPQKPGEISGVSIASIYRRAADGSLKRGPPSKLVEVDKMSTAALKSLLFI